jgi:anti-sigma regulatory factor (Ser/Thr protein kinase)
MRHRQIKIEGQRKTKKKRGSNRNINVGIRFTKDAVVIDFPKYIDLYEPHRCRRVLDFFNREFGDVDKYSNGVIFNFSNTKKISLSGGITTRCLFDYLKSKKVSININNITSDKVRQILCHIGLLPQGTVQITHDDILRWRIQSWDKKETSRKKLKMDLISTIISEITGWGERTKNHKRLYEVIPEILFNCIDHAYNDQDVFQLFYLFSGIVNDHYVFCVLDRGMGFKATYEKRTRGSLPFDNIENDGDYIRFSIEQGHSSFLKSGRGNGLPTLRENVLSLGGNVFIHSYKGKVVIFKPTREIQSENRFPLVGSLLQFSIPKG